MEPVQACRDREGPVMNNSGSCVISLFPLGSQTVCLHVSSLCEGCRIPLQTSFLLSTPGRFFPSAALVPGLRSQWPVTGAIPIPSALKWERAVLVRLSPCDVNTTEWQVVNIMLKKHICPAGDTNSLWMSGFWCWLIRRCFSAASVTQQQTIFLCVVQIIFLMVQKLASIRIVKYWEINRHFILKKFFLNI